ncbi:hypothetical protein ANOM_004539 [Aspergillus nomiae NRRL 13137]|uniref:Uncharacterized protein n=1 Tax=Aspergillus nomiae NRRL (strain ATCC 15546 / NRRL 13137 / CBS 260.88 / M93) TaxID=1509407 RepID=A0A0L1J9B0_ASPN3|nr:uncharacterized protein ANOM_004539 [Aspergillus nomiae NRRL 13137]KNG87988.1 hypothetical protein ANOM_004539 [Aspergillus nomiae NRRL 13137]
MDGIHPPRLRTDKARELFLETLQEVFQQQAEEWAAETGEEAPGPIPKCHELGVFLKYAHAVVDPDFRRAGIAPFEAGLEVLGVHEADLAETQPERYYELVQEECARVRENLEDDELSDLVNKSLIAPNLEVDDLEVKAGVITGTGYVDEYPQWYSTYLYCRHRVDADENKDNIPDAPNIHDWGWRVVFLDAEPVSYLTPLVLYGRKPRFDSIPEFLDWYCTWLDHLDARGILSLRRHANRCETDCESDCEIHNFAPAPFPPGYGEKQCI